MGLFDFLKKKKKPEKKVAEKKVEKKEVKPEIKRPKKLSFAYKVLASPHVTEKATDLGEKNKYVFKVMPKANKIEIKKAVQDLYGVEVIGVSIINIHRKKTRIGRRREGWKKGYKKAIVSIKKGQKIEIMPR